MSSFTFLVSIAYLLFFAGKTLPALIPFASLAFSIGAICYRMLTPGTFLERDYMKSGSTCQGAGGCLSPEWAKALGNRLRRVLPKKDIELSSIIDFYK
jgi:hypothetical protein